MRRESDSPYPHKNNNMDYHFEIPKEISNITKTLEEGGFEAYLVGGCVRDLFRKDKPKDWDVTTNANPEQIMKLFEKSVYENNFGTVAVINENINDQTLKVVEITPYRLEAKYSDHRHPDSIIFGNKLEDDLKRRDFTINAIAYNVSKKQVIDLYNGQQDIKDMIIRTVGKPRERFSEDALRMLRGIRLATQLGFMINADTEKAILMMGSFMNNISAERIQDEFVKIIMSDEPMKGLITANKLGILKYIVPELETGIGIKQNKDHIYEVWEHLLRSIQHSAKRSWPLHVRLSALFHDIAKPKTRFWMDEKKDYTFYGHDVVGARIANEIMVRLKFSKKMIETVTKLVRNHMFFSDIDQITLSAVRRLVSRVGPENVWDLMRVRACDRIGMGKPKETPYRLRKYESMIEEAMRAPVSVGMLKIDGIKIMDVIHETPSPRIGYILHALLEEVLENPSLNTTEYLEKKTKELAQFPEKDLKNLGKAGKEKRDEEEEKELSIIRQRHGVK